MEICGRDFGPVIVKVRGGVVVAADRPVGYMKNWPLQRVLALANRWHWRVTAFSDDERAQIDAALAEAKARQQATTEPAPTAA